MPDVDDLFNELKHASGALDQIHTDLAHVTVQLDTLSNTADAIKVISAHISSQADVLVGLAKIANQVLLFLTEQNKTMICIQEHVSKNTCLILNEAVLQTGFQRSIEREVSDLAEMNKTSYPDAALVLARARDLDRKIAECCPPKPMPPPCSYERCREPDPLQLPQQPEIPR